VISERLAGVEQPWESKLDMIYAGMLVGAQMVRMGLQVVALGCRSSRAAR
jgi:hypothetical protein